VSEKQRDQASISAVAQLAALSPHFLQVAACPACHSKLAIDYEQEALVCTSPVCGLAYPVRDGIPILLIDEARRLTYRTVNGNRGRSNGDVVAP